VTDRSDALGCCSANQSSRQSRASRWRGGIELALWCDLRVAARDATFGVYCRRFGVPLCDGGTIRLPRLIGMSRAMDMILTGRGVSGEEAYAMGLANRVVEPGTALANARELAKQIASFPQRCMRG